MTQRINKAGTYIFTLLFSLVITFLFIISCDDSPNGPEKPEPGRRDYTWTVDTLDIFMNNLSELWGSSANSVWAIGQGGEAKNFVWYYNGVEWNSYGKFVGTAPIGIGGFEQKDVWIGGSSCRISHFDGFGWERIYDLDGLGISEFSGITDFDGNSSDDMVAVGYEDSLGTKLSVAYHFDGSNWELINARGMKTYFYRIRKEQSSDRYYIMGFLSNDINPDSSNVWLYQNNEFSLIEKDVHSLEKGLTIQKIGNYVYMTKGQNIYRLTGSDKKLIYSVNDPNFGLQSYGRNENDIILRMLDGVAHYNGNDHEYLIKVKDNIRVSDVAVFEKDVFVLFFDYTNRINLIYRGTLK